MTEQLQNQPELSGPQTTEANIKHTLIGKFKQWRSGLGERWAQLHTNQIIYALALILFVFADGDIEEQNSTMWLIGLFAFFGMARELWAIFIKVWESTFGRLILLILYAAIANFTLAVASQKVNIVINADPTQLYHTLGVTTLLILPLWLMIVSVVAMIVIFGLLQILRLMRGLLVLMRIIGKKAKPKEAFPKTFSVVRLILLAPVSMTMITSLGWYGDQLNLPHTPGFRFTSSAGGIVDKKVATVGLDVIEGELQKENLSEQDRKELLTAKNKLLERLDISFNHDAPENIPKVEPNGAPLVSVYDAIVEQTNIRPPKIYFLDTLIASFVYNYEAFEYSHCLKAPDERVVYISDNDVLVVKEDKGTSTGYAFSTRTCIVAN